MYTHVQRTESTGSIHIRSADPFAPLVIRYRFLCLLCMTIGERCADMVLADADPIDERVS